MNIYSQAILAKKRPTVPFPRNMRLSDHVRPADKDGRVYEFIGTDTFGSEWYERQRFEVTAGREEVPILYTPIYNEVRDANLPRSITVTRMGPGGAVLEEIFEGGEVKFMSITSSEFSILIRHYGVGLEYSKDLVVFNELWRVPIAERAVGMAYNALLNHIHLSPILTATYAAANQTAAVTSGASTVEDFMLTVEAAITASRTDTANPRKGPYTLLISSAQEVVVEKALTNVPQQGVTLRSRVLDAIQNIIVYDGWTGTRGKKTTTYSGVTSGKGYLISSQFQSEDFQSFVKQDLANEGEERDLSRFLTQLVWDTYFGVYANPIASTEEITWPT